jgi:hypothetical protein
MAKAKTARDEPLAPVREKRVAPLSKADFVAKAKPLSMVIDGRPMVAAVKEFSTGSFGWYINGRTDIVIDGKTVPVQVSANLTVIGSKNRPES